MPEGAHGQCRVTTHVGAFPPPAAASGGAGPAVACAVRQHVAAHPFNRAVHLLLPPPAAAPASAAAVDAATVLGPAGALTFHAVTLTLTQVVALGQHWRADTCGSFAAFSARTPLDRTDAAAITPDGKLHLALTRESYQQLGLQGAISKAHPKGQRYNVCFPLKAEETLKRSNRISKLTELWADSTSALDFLCVDAQLPQPAPVLPPFLQDLEGLAHVTHVCGYTAAPLSDASLPPLTSAPAAAWADPEYLAAVHEWVGMAVCRAAAAAEGGGEAAAVHIDYKWPLEGGTAGGSLVVHSWEGLVAAGRVQAAVEACRRWVGDSAVPWAVLHVAGVADTPVAWTGRGGGGGGASGGAPAQEHRVFLGGENGYTLLVLPGDQYALFVLSM